MAGFTVACELDAACALKDLRSLYRMAPARRCGAVILTIRYAYPYGKMHTAPKGRNALPILISHLEFAHLMG